MSGMPRRLHCFGMPACIEALSIADAGPAMGNRSELRAKCDGAGAFANLSPSAQQESEETADICDGE